MLPWARSCSIAAGSRAEAPPAAGEVARCRPGRTRPRGSARGEGRAGCRVGVGGDERGRPGSVCYRDEELAAFGTAPVFLYLGRFTAVKRLPLLIRAHARAQARLGRPCPLVLVGGHPGEWEGEHPLATIRRLGAEHVFLAGWRPHDQLPQALNAADVLVLPSVAEAFGLACGLPVIACDSHGPAEIVRDGESGWLVAPDNEQALEQTLIEAVTQPGERHRRGQQAAIEARQRYGWAAIASSVAALYAEVIAVHEREGADAQERRARAGG